VVGAPSKQGARIGDLSRSREIAAASIVICRAADRGMSHAQDASCKRESHRRERNVTSSSVRFARERNSSAGGNFVSLSRRSFPTSPRNRHPRSASKISPRHRRDSLSTLTKVLKRVMTDPSIKYAHRKNKSRQMTMMMTPAKAQAPRRAPQDVPPRCPVESSTFRITAAGCSPDVVDSLIPRVRARVSRASRSQVNAEPRRPSIAPFDSRS